MAEAMAGAGGLVPSAPRRFGKYDRLIDGRLWRVKRSDFPWFALWPGQATDALKRRARVRGLRVYVQLLEDGSLAVRAQADKRGGHGN